MQKLMKFLGSTFGVLIDIFGVAFGWLFHLIFKLLD